MSERILYDADGNEVRVPEPEDAGALRSKLEAAIAEKQAVEAKWKAAEPIVTAHEASQKVEKVNAAFTGAGLSSDAAKAFLIANPNGEPTPEVVAAYAEMFPQFKAETPEPPAAPAPAAPPQHGFNFTPTPPSAGVAPGQAEVPRSEVDALMKAGRINEAKALMASGRVVMHNQEHLDRLRDYEQRTTA